MESHAEDDNSITAEQRDENSSENSGFEEKQRPSPKTVLRR